MKEVSVKIKRILMLLICIGFLGACWISWQRFCVERAADTVEMVYDYNNIMDNAVVSKKTAEDIFEIYKRAGVTSLAVYDETPENLMNNGLLRVYRGADLKATYYANPDIQADRIYIQPVLTAKGQEYFRETKENLKIRLLPQHVRYINLNGTETVEVDANYNQFLTMPLGIYKATVDAVATHGFFAVLRPVNVPHVGKEAVRQFLSAADSSKKVSAVLFQGKEVLGFEKELPYVAEELRKRNIPIVLIEAQNQLGFENQAGLLDLAEHMDYHAVRVYAMSKDELIKITPDEAASRFYVSDIERNIRMNLFPSYKFAANGETLPETNARYIASVRERLAEHGLSVGKASVLETYFPSRWIKGIVSVGAVSLAVLTLLVILPAMQKWWKIIESVGIVGSWGLLFTSQEPFVLQALALGSAVCVPVLVVSLFLDYCVEKKGRAFSSSPASLFFESLVLLWGFGLLSLAGAVFVSGLLSDTRFFLEMEIFRGVKLTFVMPLLLISLVYIRKFPFWGRRVVSGEDFVRFLNTFCHIPVKLGMLLLLGLIAVIGFIFVGRSGNNGAPVPQFEVELRRFLESVMYARPREKEFLFGHPAILFSLAAMYQRWPQLLHYFLILAVTIGQGSMVETFAHMRSPFLLSLVRGIDGLAVGTLTVAGALLLVMLITKMTQFFGEKYGKP